MFKHLTITGTALAAAMLFAPSDAAAQQYIQNASGICQGALPVFDTNLRNRPLAVSNEGTSNAFVSCAMHDRYGNASSLFGAWIHNNTAAAVDVSCTLISGNAVDGPTYFPKTQAYAAGTGAYILWSTADNGGANFGSQGNFSCNLPPGVELRLVTNLSTSNF